MGTRLYVRGHTAVVELLRELWLKFCRNTTSSYYSLFFFGHGCQLEGALPFMKSLLYS